MAQTSPITLSDRMRVLTKGILHPIAARLNAWGVHPDAITVIGTILVGIAALFIADGRLIIAGVIVLVGIPLDALDGSVARLRGPARPFGAFLDSTLDRYADGFLLGGLAVYGMRQDDETILVLALISLVGAYLISYTRARAEGLGLSCAIGLFSRFERTVTLLVLLFTGWVMPLLIVLAVGTHFTALQRMWHVRKLTDFEPAASHAK